MKQNLNEAVFSVSEFIDFLNEAFSGRSYIVEGEVSEFKQHPTGVYFSLKDKNAEGVLYCYMNPYAYRTLGIRLEDGILVKASGSARIYKPKGRFSFVVERIELSGEGSLQKAYELLKKKLEEEGLFARKRKIPEFIETIGIITSKTGAVIDDFRKNLKPLGMKLFLYDVRVEGARAHEHISNAIEWFNAHMPECDVIVLIRGGGSLEDLQPFNNERVARAVFGSHIPVIAGIGHDRDIPIASMVSDSATSTPSFAAMIVNESWKCLFEEVPNAERTIFDWYTGVMRSIRATMKHAAEKCLFAIRYIHMRTRAYAGIISANFLEAFRRDVVAYTSAERIIFAMSPERNLKLGYSIVFDNTGKVVKNIGRIAKDDLLSVMLSDGSFDATVNAVKRNYGKTKKTKIRN